MRQFKKYVFIYSLISIVFFYNINAAGADFYIKRPVSSAEAAAFSLLVYHDKENQPPIPDEFVILCKCPVMFQNRNYYGEAYYRFEYGFDRYGHKFKEPTGVTIVIAHRGTQLNIDNLSDDLQILIKEVPQSFFMSSKLFTEYVRSLVYSMFPAAHSFQHYFVHTGHSLGAIHAELNHMHQSVLDGWRNTTSIVFESPGVKEIIEDLMARNIFPGSFDWWGMNIEIINSDVNLINTANEQFGVILQIPGYEFISKHKIDISPLDIKYFVTFFTMDQHSMVNIYNYLKSGRPPFFFGGSRYPVGIIEAFKYYKTYNIMFNPKHYLCWERMFEIYWNSHQELHAGYHGSLESYKEYMIKHHYLY